MYFWWGIQWRECSPRHVERTAPSSVFELRTAHFPAVTLETAFPGLQAGPLAAWILQDLFWKSRLKIHVATVLFHSRCRRAHERRIRFSLYSKLHFFWAACRPKSKIENIWVIFFFLKKIKSFWVWILLQGRWLRQKRKPWCLKRPGSNNYYNHAIKYTIMYIYVLL